MTTFLEARKEALSIMKLPTGWKRYEDGQAPLSKTTLPPWVIFTVKPQNRFHCEAGETRLRYALIEARIVNASQLSVDLLAEKLIDMVEAAKLQNIEGMSIYRDSGSYPGDMKNLSQNMNYVVRVVEWRFAFNI